jgi:hypothetical protein
MATQTINLASHPGQLSTTIQLWSADMLTMAQEAVASEQVWMGGLYSAQFTDVPAGSYFVHHVDSAGRLLWTSCVILTLTTATFVAHDAAFVSVSGGGGLDAAGVRAAVGLAAANLDTQLTGIANSASSADSKLTAERLQRIDRIPDIAAGAAGGIPIVGSEMGLTAAVMAALPVSVRDEILTAWATGTQVFGHSYLESIKRIEVASGAATLSGAGTGTEVMTSSDASKTATFTVDDDGNVTSVVWS